MKIILTSFIGAVIIAVIASISTTFFIDLHRKAKETGRTETERIESINNFIIEEWGY